jgi:5-methyltetrahydropteroyltriglutamate--homocysteine methyltransferase
LFPTCLVGSYPQPDWLIDRAKLSHRLPPRVRARELWRVAPEWLEQAQDDATILAIRDQERAGLDIITDGEIRRESYSNRFATALEGIDLDNPASIVSRSGETTIVPLVTGKIRRKQPVEVRDVRFLRTNTTRRIKATVPGPFTMSQQAQNDFYATEEEMALNYAAAVNDEIKDLFAAGADIVQIDEPWMQARPEKARRFGLTALQRALDGVTGETAIHLCFGYAAIVRDRPSAYSFLTELADSPVDAISIETAQSSLDCSVLTQLPGKTIILGVLDLSTDEIETPEIVAARIRRALPYVSPEKLVVAPDCGLKYLPRDVAFEKMKALAAGACLVR